MDKHTAICNYLKKHHTGKTNAVHSNELEKLFDMTGRNIRYVVNHLRKEGFPICSDEDGYYYAETQAEINATVKRLNEFLTRVSNARTGMLYASVIAPPNSEIKITIEVKGGG